MAGTDILSLIAGGTNGLNVMSSGNVGIGTTSPTAQLHTKGNLNTSLTGTVATTAASTTVTGTSTLFTTELAVGDAIKIGSEVFTINNILSATSLTLDSAATPTASGLTAYKDPNLFAIDDGDGTNQFVVDKSGNTTIAGDLTVSGTSTLSNIEISTDSISAPLGTDMTFITGPSGGSLSESLVIADDGNVGIGTTSPLSKLQVVGDGFFSGLTDKYRYLNFGDTVGETGYGIRNFNGMIESKDSDDTKWTAVGVICPETTRDEDGNIYDVVQIGNHCWMAENLNVGTRIDSCTGGYAGACTDGGDTLQNQTDNDVIEKYCYGDDEANCTAEGGLYQWNEAMAYATADGSQGICMDGWHMPTDAEQNELDQYLTDVGNTCVATRSGWDCDSAGTKLKTGGTSDFEGLLTGHRDANGSFNDRGAGASFWSSTESGTTAWWRGLNSSYSTVHRHAHNETSGFSVRCLKN
jgi:uncharacterized protein (TIGR02145 family)